MISILLAEDHEVVREGFRALLENDRTYTIVAETGDGLDVMPLIEMHRPNVLILDLMLPGLSGLEVVRRVRVHCPWMGIVMLSMYSHPAYVSQALHFGASAYVLKESGAGILKAAVNAVVRGERFLDPALPEELLEGRPDVPDDPSLDPYVFLSEREREVLHLAVEGSSLKDTAERLAISPRTVEKHRASIMRKLGLKNQAELIRFAVYRGLIGPSGTSIPYPFWQDPPAPD